MKKPDHSSQNYHQVHPDRRKPNNLHSQEDNLRSTPKQPNQSQKQKTYAGLH
nr:MAG TPA: hypothetical protein [Microviridae sp.]